MTSTSLVLLPVDAPEGRRRDPPCSLCPGLWELQLGLFSSFSHFSFPGNSTPFPSGNFSPVPGKSSRFAKIRSPILSIGVRLCFTQANLSPHPFGHCWVSWKTRGPSRHQGLLYPGSANPPLSFLSCASPLNLPVIISLLNNGIASQQMLLPHSSGPPPSSLLQLESFFQRTNVTVSPHPSPMSILTSRGLRIKTEFLMWSTRLFVDCPLPLSPVSLALLSAGYFHSSYSDPLQPQALVLMCCFVQMAPSTLNTLALNLHLGYSSFWF